MSAAIWDHEISNEDLRAQDVPPPDADYYKVVVPFALSFDGYEVFGGFEPLARFADGCAARFKRCGRLPRTLTGLRSCLFFEQRRWRWAEPTKISKEGRKYVSAVLEAIREQARKG